MPVPLEPGKYYHLYNHANGNENLFRKEDNYLYFFKKYSKYIAPVTDTFCYCLMPNHFHLLVQIKSVDELTSTLQEFETLGAFDYKKISQRFSHLFNSYTQAYNKMYARKGSLFNPNFKRIEITSKNYLIKLAHYIHYNPVHHGFTKKPGLWTYSSFNSLISPKPTILERAEVISWFDDLDNFKYYHKLPADIDFMNELE